MYVGLLRELVESVPGARGAVFCDREGEAVNSVGASGRVSPESLDDYELRVVGAQLATPIDEMLQHCAAELGVMRELVVRGTRETLLVHYLKDGYYLVVCLEPEALVSRGMATLRRFAVRVASEI